MTHFTDQQIESLVNLRARLNHRDDQPIQRAVIEDHQVVQFRLMTATEVLDELIASCLGDVE